MESNLAESFEIQNIIIKMQSEVINELLTVLMQHVTAEEADALPCIGKINRAAKLKATM